MYEDEQLAGIIVKEADGGVAQADSGPPSASGTMMLATSSPVASGMMIPANPCSSLMLWLLSLCASPFDSADSSARYLLLTLPSVGRASLLPGVESRVEQGSANPPGLPPRGGGGHTRTVREWLQGDGLIDD